MNKRIYLSILLLIFISCNVNTQSVALKNITCNGIDVVSIGEKVQTLRSNMQGKYIVSEYFEDSSLSINLGSSEFITIVYFKNRINAIGVFCQNYNLDDRIFIGMKIEALQAIIPEIEVVVNHHDSYEYIEYLCDTNIIEILVESEKDNDATVGIYDTDSDRTSKFDVNASVIGFIIKSGNL